MEIKKIEILLEKYYKGETSFEEENILNQYFNSDNVDSKFNADKDIFIYNSYNKTDIENIPDISDEIWNNIKEDRHRPVSKITYFYLRIAAGILILIGTFFIFNNHLNTKRQDYQFSDTYEQPEDAYKQAKQTLLFVSEMLNKGTQHMEPIQKVSREAQKLDKISFLNDGLKEFNKINKYNIANKYFKQ